VRADAAPGLELTGQHRRERQRWRRRQRPHSHGPLTAE
jgi:hypothetical protein